jgi:hypothetical protein
MVVFSNALECARFAMTLLEAVDETDWAALLLPPDTSVRVGIHTGPCYHAYDTVIRQFNYLGRHINLAESIEPITTPGCAFVSEQFAASVAMAQARAQTAAVRVRARGSPASHNRRLSQNTGLTPAIAGSSAASGSFAAVAAERELAHSATTDRFSLQHVGATRVEMLLEGMLRHAFVQDLLLSTDRLFLAEQACPPSSRTKRKRNMLG